MVEKKYYVAIDEDNQAYELLAIIRWLIKLSEEKDITAIMINAYVREEEPNKNGQSKTVHRL